MKAVAYCLQLHDDDTPLSTQEQAIRAWARSVGIEVAKVITDQAFVMPAHDDRPEQVLLEAEILSFLEQPLDGAGAFVVADGYRLERLDLRCQINLRRELSELGLRVLVVGDPYTKPKRSRKRSVRRKALAVISVTERLRLGREAGARAGKHQSGPAPYGYTRDYSQRPRLVADPVEAAVVRTIFKEYLRRRSMKRLIEFLASQGLRTRRGKEWSRAGVSWILKNETYLGRVHFGAIRARGQHPALISPIMFNKVQKLIRKNNKRGGKREEVE